MKKGFLHLISPADSLPGGLLEAGDGLVEPVRLGLERLHLLPDRVHLEAVACELGDGDRLTSESKNSDPNDPWHVLSQ